MTDEMNRSAHIPPEAPPATDIAAANHMLNQITPPIRAAMQTVMRGVLTGYQGVPAHVLLQVMCFETSLFCGQALQADLSMTLQLRAQWKKAFDDGMKNAPLLQRPGNWSPPEGEKITGREG